MPGRQYSSCSIRRAAATTDRAAPDAAEPLDPAPLVTQVGKTPSPSVVPADQISADQISDDQISDDQISDETVTVTFREIAPGRTEVTISNSWIGPEFEPSYYDTLRGGWAEWISRREKTF